MKTLEQTIHYNPDLTQIINGEEVMSPSPRLHHQAIVANLFRALIAYIDPRELGDVFFAPLDVVLAEGCQELQPDLIFISNDNAGIKREWIDGVPDLVVEVVSPTSKKTDTKIKKDIYERHGVSEYWIVLPEKVCIEVYVSVDGRYTLFGSFSDEEMVRSGMFDDLSFSVKSVMS
jgi:Uma2 family endonuclease